jgi:hypothetical protein
LNFLSHESLFAYPKIRREILKVAHFFVFLPLAALASKSSQALLSKDRGL